MSPDSKAYIPPFRQSRPEVPARVSSMLPIGLPPTVPDQRALVARQLFNRSKFASTTRLSQELPRLSAKGHAIVPFSGPDTLHTHTRHTPRDKTTERPGPGPGPRSKKVLPTYTQLANLHLGLGDRFLNTDLNPLTDLSPKFGEGIKDVKYVGSYKWILPDRSGRLTLAVPGMPDVWDPVKRVGRLELDRDIPGYKEFPDYAATLLPPNLSTLEPTFRALTSPSSLSCVNIVSGRNSLRKLWSAVNPEYNDHSTPFRIDLVNIDGMILLERYEPPGQLDARPSQGYHLNYHETQTRKIMEGSDRTPGCVRIIKYSFGGLEMIVKYDVAAYLPLDVDDHEYTDDDNENGNFGSGLDAMPRNRIRPSQSTASEIDHSSLDGLSSLTEDMDGLDFDDPVHNGQSLAIVYFPHQRPPPQSSLISINTQFHRHQCDLDYYFPQHFFAQVPTLFYARHKNGDFSKFDLVVYEMLDEEIRKKQQAGIDMMAALLRWIVVLVKDLGEKRLKGIGGTKKAEGHTCGLGLVWDGKKFSVALRQLGPQLSAPVVEMIKDARSS